MLCLAVALLGISGVHTHLDVSHHHESPASAAHQHHAPYTVSVIDADHHTDHAQHGDLDLDPVVKALIKASLTVMAPLAVLLYVLLLVADGVSSKLVLRPRTLRPPKRKPSLYFLPPSHAPPIAALSH
jgi:hypothetical protein